MKKDGIQTRNRKMSTKSKKNKKNASMCDLLRPMDKAFSTFSPPSHMQHPMHTPMPTYMTGSSLPGGSFMSHGPSHQTSHMATGGLAGSGLTGGFSLGPTSLSSASLSSFGLTSSGLNLSSNSGMVGALA